MCPAWSSLDVITRTFDEDTSIAASRTFQALRKTLALTVSRDVQHPLTTRSPRPGWSRIACFPLEGNRVAQRWTDDSTIQSVDHKNLAIDTAQRHLYLDLSSRHKQMD
jgi:hypothetical protein